MNTAEPEINITPELKDSGPVATFLWQTDSGKIYIELDGSNGKFSDIYLTINILDSDKEHDDLPFMCEVPRIIERDGSKMMPNENSISEKIYEEIVLSLSEYVPFHLLTKVNFHLPSLVRKLQRQYKR